MKERYIEYLDPGRLTPWKNNARTHSRKQLRQLKACIRRFGFTQPVLIDEDNRIMAGHGRVEAAKSLGMDAVQCIRIEHLRVLSDQCTLVSANRGIGRFRQREADAMSVSSAFA